MFRRFFLDEAIISEKNTHGKSWEKTTSFILSNESTFLATK
jgi:hypothetical protein